MQNKIIYIAIFALILLITTSIIILFYTNSRSNEVGNVSSVDVTVKAQKFSETGTYINEGPELSKVIGKLKKIEAKDNLVYGIFEISDNKKEQKILIYKPGNTLAVEFFSENDINQIHDKNQKVVDFKSEKDVTEFLKENLNKNLLLNIVSQSPEQIDETTRKYLNCNKKLNSQIEERDFNALLHCDPYVWSLGKYE